MLILFRQLKVVNSSFFFFIATKANEEGDAKFCREYKSRLASINHENNHWNGTLSYVVCRRNKSEKLLLPHGLAKGQMEKLKRKKNMNTYEILSTLDSTFDIYNINLSFPNLDFRGCSFRETVQNVFYPSSLPNTNHTL